MPKTDNDQATDDEIESLRRFEAGVPMPVSPTPDARSQTTVSLDRRELTWLVALCDGRAHNLQKMVDGDPDEDTADARCDIADLKTLARKLRDARGF